MSPDRPAQGARPEAGGQTPAQLRARRRALIKRRRIRRRRAIAVLAALGVAGVPGGVLLTQGGGSRNRPQSHRLASTGAAAAPRVITLPRGGETILPGHLVVAFYGIVGTANILGQTHDPEADAAGVQRQARQYARFGASVLPAFELVATIASPDPGPQGTYSSPLGEATIVRYLRVAHRHRLLLILDVQPGRGEFLAQVQRLSRFLRDPSVGVALDPEWKLAGGQVPDQAVGSASAASVNAVSSYLAAIVARYRLPQKLFIVHEFRLSELPDRSHIVARPGLATVLQMDGLGPVALKLDSYHTVMRGARGFFPGFKLFLQRSADPELMSPRRVLALRPRPVYISYQ